MSSGNSSVTTYPTYVSVREEKMKLISDMYYRQLNDYIQTYTSYLNGQNGVTSDTVAQKNNALLQIASQIKKNNQQIKQDAATIFQQYQESNGSVSQNARNVQQLNRDLQSRNQDMTSYQQLTLQMQELTRHQYKIFWIRLFFVLLLAAGIVIICIKISGKVPDLFNFPKHADQVKQTTNQVVTATQNLATTNQKV